MAPQRRRARGERAVFKRASDGLWVGTLDLGVVDGHRRRKAVYGQSEREVLQKLSTLRTAHDRGIDLLAPALTVGQWLDVWLSDIKGFDGTRPRTDPVRGTRRSVRKAGDRRRPARQADPGAYAATCYRDTEQSDITRYPTQRFYVAARVQADPERPG